MAMRSLCLSACTLLRLFYVDHDIISKEGIHEY